ncbi:MAG: hypothetical protein JWO87_1452, partial [Phycisphaerales bacterium]|nr:hypothetical protein [Phycisphaerales bacterium]
MILATSEGQTFLRFTHKVVQVYCP